MHAIWYLIALAFVAFCAWRISVVQRRAKEMRAEREAAMAMALAAAQKAAKEVQARKPAEAAAAPAPVAPPTPTPRPQPPAPQAPRTAEDTQARAAARADAERLELEAARRAKVQKAARAEAERRATLEAQAREAAAAQAPAAPPVVAAPPAPVAPPAVKTPAETLILLVDDSKMVRVKTSRLLEGADYRVVQAIDGVDAVRQLESCQPDLVITDVDMPNMDGFGLARHLRGNARTAEIPIVMITSAEDRHREGAMREGVGLVLGKPYPEDALLAHIRSFKFVANTA